MSDETEVFNSDRVLSDRPKRACDLTREELELIVNNIQLFMFSEAKLTKPNDEVWNSRYEVSDSELVEFIGYTLRGFDLEIDEKYDGERVELIADIKERLRNQPQV